MGVGCRYDQARVIREFEHIVSGGFRAKIGRCYDVRKRSQTGALNDARHNRSESWLDIVEFCTVSGQEIDHPVVNIWRQVEEAQFLRNIWMLDCIERLAEVERKNDDVLVRE